MTGSRGTHVCPWHACVSMARMCVYGTYVCPWHVCVSMARMCVHGTYVCLWHVCVSMARMCVYDTYAKSKSNIDLYPAYLRPTLGRL